METGKIFPQNQMEFQNAAASRKKAKEPDTPDPSDAFVNNEAQDQDVTVKKKTVDDLFAKKDDPEAEPISTFWSFLAKDKVSAKPVIGQDRTIFVGSDDNNLYAIDVITGKEKWRFKTDGMIQTAVTLGRDNNILLPSRDGKVYSLDEKTGKKKWEFNMGAKMFSIPAPPAEGLNGLIFVTGDNETLHAVKADTGEKVWEFKGEKNRIDAPRCAVGPDGTVFTDNGSNNLFALDPDSGKVKWEFKAGDDRFSTPVFGKDGAMYFTNGDEKTYAVDSRTGKKKWEAKTGDLGFDFPGGFPTPVIGDNGLIYVINDKGKVSALDEQTGKKKWSKKAEGFNFKIVLAEDKNLYVFEESGSVNVFDSKTGEEKSYFTLGPSMYSAPAMDSTGFVFVGDMIQSFFHALSINDYKIASEKQKENADQENIPVKNEQTPGIEKRDGTVNIGGVVLEVREED